MRQMRPLLEIDLAALCENYRRLAAATPRAEAAGIVKCDAYGLGAEEVGRVLQQKAGCRSFFVASSEEGAALRAALGSEAEIYVFYGPFAGALDAFRDHRLTPVINTLEQASLWASAFAGAPAAIHIDTGMNRLGLPLADLAGLHSVSGLKVSLAISHLACAAQPADPMNARQLKLFTEAAARFPEARRSLSSSGGALIGEEFGFDLVRLGVGVYGASPLDEGDPIVKSVARLSAPVIQLREIGRGETVGYGATFAAERPTTLATVAIGYGDGLLRSGSGKAGAVLGGAYCKIAGRISMDLIVLDVTDAPHAISIGDPAEFFGPALSIDEAAKSYGTIGYELLTNVGGLARPGSGLGGRVERRYLWGRASAAERPPGAEGN